jgi:hypothetical protein
MNERGLLLRVHAIFSKPPVLRLLWITEGEPVIYEIGFAYPMANYRNFTCQM